MGGHGRRDQRSSHLEQRAPARAIGRARPGATSCLVGTAPKAAQQSIPIAAYTTSSASESYSACRQVEECMARRQRNHNDHGLLGTRGLAAIAVIMALVAVRRTRQPFESRTQADMTHTPVRSKPRSRPQYVAAVIMAVIGVMLVGLSITGLDIPDPFVSLLLLGLALVLATAGVLVWWPDRETEGSRGNLGAALLSGAVITFTVFGFQLGDARRQAAIDRKY
jgi:hypothetical protein